MLKMIFGSEKEQPSSGDNFLEFRRKHNAQLEQRKAQKSRKGGR